MCDYNVFLSLLIAHIHVLVIGDVKLVIRSNRKTVGVRRRWNKGRGKRAKGWDAGGQSGEGRSQS